MRLSIAVFLVFFSFPGQSQVKVDRSNINFGVLEQGSDRLVDFTFTNYGQKPATVLRSGFTFEYDILYSARQIKSGESFTLRVQYNPRSLGSFKEVIDVWFDSMTKPVSLTFKGDVAYIDNTNNEACPDFRERPPGMVLGNDFQAVVFDAESGKPIKDARVRIIQNGVIQKSLTTNREGNTGLNVPIGFYFLVADAEGYEPADTVSYINRRNNYFRFDLPPKENSQIEAVSMTEITENKNWEEEEEIHIRIEFKKEPDEEKTIEKEEAESLPMDEEDEFLPESLYARNNIVFLVDVSHSMNQKGKLELLKASMIELTDVIRDIDQVTLITYASTPKVMLKGLGGADRGKIAESIQSLEAGGMTSGAKGFKKAYDLAKSQFIEGGNNQVIVATDGSFKAQDNAVILKLATKYKRKGIQTSTIGIRSNTHATKKLSEISESGNGSFLYMDDYDVSLTLLIEEIKRQSRK